MAEGRGAWTARGKATGAGIYARVNGKRRDGSIPDTIPAGSDKRWYECVHSGVLGIQTLLNYHAMESVLPSGIYGRKTRRAVVKFQDEQQIHSDGKTGMQTMQKLLHPVVEAAAHQAKVGPQWIWGLARQESAYDPSAQGWSTPDDLGLWQFNTSDGTPTHDQAFDPLWAANAVCKRFREAEERFSGKGARIRIDCAIVQHRSPVAAQHLYDEGEPYGPESEQYVESVRGFAESW